MTQNHKELISMALSLFIVVWAFFIVHRFLPSLMWAGVIAIATYPLYKKWRIGFGNYHNTSAFLFTSVLGLIILLPLSWLITILIKEAQYFVNYLQHVNKHGEEAPLFLQQVPFFGSELTNFWNKNFALPGSLRFFFSNIHLNLTPASYYVKQVSFNLAHRGFQLGFTLLCLFFFYRDGDKLFSQINRVGEACLGARWFHYANKLPTVLRGTVNGTILVGLAVGILMGISYWMVGLKAPTLLGFITAIAAMIPFAVPLVLIVVGLILFAQGSLISAVSVIIWGTVVMFIADHFVKPVLIGGAIQLPFLAVLFGILGGVENMGLLGLFIGPMVMVLFVTLWYESQGNTKSRMS